MDKQPILIYGPRKSGSTLLHNLIDGHADILTVPGELKLKCLLEVETGTSEVNSMRLFLAKGLSYLDDSFFESGLINLSEVADVQKTISVGSLNDQELQSQLDVGAYLKKLDDLRNENILLDMKNAILAHTSCLHDSMKKQQEYKYWAFKEVGGSPESVLLYFRSMYPNGKIILNTRDYLFVVRSIILERRRRGVVLSNRNILKECKKVIGINRCFKRLKEAGSPNTHHIKYEDLVEDTGKEMSAVADFLNIPFSNTLTEPTVFSINKKVDTSSENTSKVFNNQKQLHWSDGLTFREQLVINKFRISAKMTELLNS